MIQILTAEGLVNCEQGSHSPLAVALDTTAEIGKIGGCENNMSNEPVTANTEQNSEQLTGRKRSLANLKPWPKGFCPNPKGRGPKPITEAYAKLAHKKVPGDRKGRTYAELIAEVQYTAAGKGKTEAAREIADRLEGKAAQPFGDDTPNMSVTLNIEVVRKKLFGDDE